MSASSTELSDQIWNLIDRCRRHTAITYAELVGVLALIQADVCDEARAKAAEGQPDLLGMATCRVCGHTWRDTAEAGADPDNLKCPNCGHDTGSRDSEPA